jgi:Trk K+ transport system NAD-binding subunit
MRQHFILCGLGKIGWRVLEQLRAAGVALVAVDNHCHADDPRLGGVTLVRGDARQADVLRRAGIEQARGVVILTSEDLVSLSIALLVRELHPTIRVVVRLFNQSLISRLGSAMGNMQALSASALAAPLLALIARTGRTIGMVDLGEGRRRQIAELTVANDSPLVGRRLDEMARANSVTLVAHESKGHRLRFLDEIDAGATIAVDDRLVVCGPPEQVAPLLAESQSESLPELLWAGIVRRFSRVFARSVAMVDWPVKVCAVIFFSVILISVIVFRFGMKDDDTVDAFYRTISLLATGADMHGDDVERGSWQKAFISGLRLVGTALTAAFTAIFTNYLIRANLGGALEVRRIPERGHIVVCGLGNVGFRVVEELMRLGEPVVVIEANAANSFISTARRLGAAVIVGSATVAQVLRQAHADSARAIVAATSSDLVNLEIGLLVRELAPRQRVVLRLIDSQLASTLRQSANVRLAVSIPELAAPAFVAALYGDQVRGMFQVQGRMLAVFDLVVQEQETDLIGRPLGDLVRANHLAPLAWTSTADVDKPLDDRESVAVGDRLTVLMVLDHLQQWMQREMKRHEAVTA